MKRSMKPAVVLFVGVSMLFGLSACDAIPDDIASRLPEVTRPVIQRPTATTAAPEQTESAPAETAPAQTEEPAPQETVTVVQTQPAETVVVETTREPTAEATSEAPAEEGEGTPAWVWWLVGLLALALVAGGVVLWRLRQVRVEWDRRLGEARSEFAWFEGSIVPQILAKPTAGEASALWRAAQPRVLAADKDLYGLGENAPTPERAESARDGFDALRKLVAAVEDETSTMSGMDADALRARRAALDSARAEARRWISESQG